MQWHFWDSNALSKSVLISGNGIAGPTLAYWLCKHGFAPTLIEQSPSLRTGGYVIDFWGLGFDVSERMSLDHDLRCKGYDIEEVRFVDRKGKRVGGFGADVFRTLTDGKYVSIARSDLAKLIYRTIEGRCETIFGDSVAAIEQTGAGVNVTFEKGAQRRFDLVVGADGLHSRIRSLAFGRQERFEKYLGYVVAAFQTTGYRPRDEAIYVSYSLPGKQVSRFAMRDDRTLFLFVFAADQHSANTSDPEAQMSLLSAEFGDGGWECPQILSALKRCDDLYFDRVSQIRMERWSNGRVTLVGDAAFCPSLLAGQGAALAVAASYVLAGELSASRSTPELALDRYEQLLRPLIVRKQKAAERFARALAPRTRLGIFIRNQITKAFGLPGVAELVIGQDLHDRMDLPDYPITMAVAVV